MNQHDCEHCHCTVIWAGGIRHVECCMCGNRTTPEPSKADAPMETRALGPMETK